MYTIEFAYTRYMQLILFFVSCATTFLFFWFTTNIILSVYGEKVSIRKRLAFIFFTGIVLNQVWTYGIYALGGFLSFSPKVYSLVTVPNPFFALLYYYFGIKFLGLKSYRSIRLMRHVYAYWMATKIILQIIGRAFFPQVGGPYNYLLDTISLSVCAIINTCIYLVINFSLYKSGFLIRLTDGVYTRLKRYELFITFVQASIIYCFVVFTPKLIGTSVITYVYIEIFLILFMIIFIMRDYFSVINAEIENKGAYINTLISSIDRFDGIRHDFNNILQTYGGYIVLKDIDGLNRYHEKVTGTTLMATDELDLNRYMYQNPALVSLLIKKYECAKENHVLLRVTILSSLDDFEIENIDLCRIMGNLLDNAIESASMSNLKRVSLSIEYKIDGRKLIVISNTTNNDVDTTKITLPNITTKLGHSGLGLAEVRKIINKYSQCSVQFSYYNKEFSVYIDMLSTKNKEQKNREIEEK